MDSLVIENRALVHLSNIMIANARVHNFKEMAELAKSKRANDRLCSAISTFIALVGSKGLTDPQKKIILKLKKELSEVRKSTDKAPDKTDKLAEIIDGIEEIIRIRKWYDMPTHNGADMNLIAEFYGGEPVNQEEPPKE